MNPLEYLHLQLRLEGRQIVNGDALRQVEIVPDEEMPLMVIVQLADGQVVAYSDESLPPDLHRDLMDQIQTLEFPTIEPLLAVLETRTMATEFGHYKTYAFPESLVHFNDPDISCRSSNDPLIQDFGFGGFPGQVYAVEQNGKVVSACVSTRENRQCSEAWVYTAEACRKQGLAQQVVSAWAQSMLQTGRVPFYSHKIGNTASARLAKRLGLKPVFEEIAITYMKV
ncbi:MAG TPA: GNAT family N-acetyltransferase [Anaerolineales bacterium]|nr:GNAT family N-acetyltransferase [Anaerolineales bacterium]